MCNNNNKPNRKKEHFPAHARRVERLIYHRNKGIKDKALKKRKAQAPARFNHLFQFVYLHDTPEKCMQYLESIRFKDGRFCTHCGMFETKETETPFLYECNVCNELFSVITNSPFEAFSENKLPHFLTALYLENSFAGGVTGGEIEIQLPYCRKIGTLMTQQIRRYAYNQLCFDMQPVTENDKAVYVIDTTLRDGKDAGRHDYRKGSYDGGIDKFIILVIIQKDGNARAYIVDSVDRESVMPHILNDIPKGCRIYTDEHSSFKILKQLGFIHKAVNHKKKQFGVGDVSTNLVECFNSFLKAGLMKFRNSIPPLYAQLFVNAAIFRFNTRNMNESEKLDFAVTNLFTKFKDQQHRLENYKQATIDFRKGEHEKRRIKRAEKERVERIAIEKRRERKARQAKAAQKRLEKQAKREQKQLELEQKRQARQAKREQKQLELEQKRQARQAKREQKQLELKQKQQAKQAGKAKPIIKASHLRQPINLKKIKQPIRKQASKPRKATVKK